MTRKFGIIAHPVEHSLSPAMHNAAFQALGIDATFEKFDVKPEELEDFLKAHANYEGFSVSLPHKEAVIGFLDGIDDVARAIGAVNTIYTKDGKHYGTNTDAGGFLRALKEIMPDLSGKRVLILGAGGFARAAVATLKPVVDSITIINRTIPKGVALAKAFACRYGGKIEDLFTETPDLIVNATTVGLTPGDTTEIVPQEFIKPEIAIFDAVYQANEVTHLIQEAKKAGSPTVSGEKLLLYQGVLQFEIWTGQKPPEDVMAEALKGILDGEA